MSPEYGETEDVSKMGTKVDHARPFVGAFQVRSWGHWFVIGAILWALIAKN